MNLLNKLLCSMWGHAFITCVNIIPSWEHEWAQAKKKKKPMRYLDGTQIVLCKHCGKANK